MTTAFCLKKKKGKTHLVETETRGNVDETNSRNPFTEVNDFDERVTRNICCIDIFLFPFSL